jgi:hypothetical protein
MVAPLLNGEICMSDLRIQVPARVYDQLQAKKISMITIRQAVLKTLEELAEKPRTRKPKPGETANEYFRRIILERRGGVPPSPDEPFLKGMTRAQYFASSDQERDALWKKWDREAWNEIDREERKRTNGKADKNPSRQKHSASNARRVSESRGKYRAKRRGTNRA